MSNSGHQRLYFMCFPRYAGGEVLAPIFGHDNVVFQTDADLPFGQIQAWFHCQNHSRLKQRFPMTDIMYFQSQMMRYPMPEKIIDSGRIG